MRLNGVRNLAFSSTGSVYGDAKFVPTPEDAPFPVQTSLYAASKVACEALISAYCEGFGLHSWIFRFVSILGERYTHGHVFDFCRKLRKDDSALDVLGNGMQTKSYLYVHDCIDAMLIAVEQSKEKVNIFNLGVSDTCSVTDSIGWITDELGVSPTIRYAGGNRGWVGDSPLIHLDTRKINDLGWRPKLSIEDGIRETVRFLLKNPWVLKKETELKICVFGLWHLGSVTAACLASLGHSVVGLDDNPRVVSSLSKGKAPLFEPGLDELLVEGLENGCLRFSTDVTASLHDVDLVWVTFDTPVDENDAADADFVIQKVQKILNDVPEGGLILVSSQLPVGSVKRLENLVEAACAEKNIHFACCPENLRLGQAIKVFLNPDRVVVGFRNEADKQLLAEVFNSLSTKIIWMSVESSEMVKHALNGFLATSVVFGNEIGAFCEVVGADALDVISALKHDERIGHKAYIAPGLAFAGGTLARDVNFLSSLEITGANVGLFFQAVTSSNQNHKDWVKRQLQRSLLLCVAKR